MDALDALLTRSSSPRLREPAPAGALRDRIFLAALRAPDHARLRPWRFLVVEGEGRVRLGEAMARAMQRHAPQADEEALQKLRANPLRAPLVLVVLCRVQEHPKVPPTEQELSAGCAAHAILLAAHAAGFGGIWRTGPVTYMRELHEELGLACNERVLGFLYIGTPDAPPRVPGEADPAAHFAAWPAG